MALPFVPGRTTWFETTPARLVRQVSEILTCHTRWQGPSRIVPRAPLKHLGLR